MSDVRICYLIRRSRAGHGAELRTGVLRQCVRKFRVAMCSVLQYALDAAHMSEYLTLLISCLKAQSRHILDYDTHEAQSVLKQFREHFDISKAVHMQKHFFDI